MLKKELPAVVGHHTSYVVNNKLYVFGGWQAIEGVQVYRSFVYDPVTDQWDSIAPMNYKDDRCQAFGCVIDNEIYLFGGFQFQSNQHIYTKTAEKYNTVSDEWTQLADMPEFLSAGISVEYNGKIYLFGGDTESNYSNGTHKPTGVQMRPARPERI